MCDAIGDRKRNNDGRFGVRKNDEVLSGSYVCIPRVVPGKRIEGPAGFFIRESQLPAGSELIVKLRELVHMCIINQMKKRVIFCVIAHPDDEAFGPSGTLALLAKTEDVHVICVTDGASEPRFHPVGGKTLANMRIEELRASANVLGIKHIHMLGYADGSLNNNLYHAVAAKIQKLVATYRPSLLITTELRGVSGHLDHVAVAMITSYIYRENSTIDAIWYNCTTKTTSNLMRNYFIFFPPGFERHEVDMIVNIRSVLSKKVAAARCHKSQQKDAVRVIAKWLISPKEEWFFINKRRDTLTIG